MTDQPAAYTPDPELVALVTTACAESWRGSYDELVSRLVDLIAGLSPIKATIDELGEIAQAMRERLANDPGASLKDLQVRKVGVLDRHRSAFQELERLHQRTANAFGIVACGQFKPADLGLSEPEESATP